MSIQTSIIHKVDKVRFIIDKRFLKTSKHKADDRNFELLYKIQPVGNVKAMNKHIELGDGYMTCLRIYAVPDELVRNWMFSLFKRSNCITTIDFETLDRVEVKKNIDRAISENKSRLYDAKKESEGDEAANTVARLKTLLAEVNQLGNSIKAIHIRLYIYGRTFEELENNRVAIEAGLYDDEFAKYAVNVNEQGAEYRSFFLPISEQQKTFSERKGLPCPSNIAAFGIPFHYVGWRDKYGFYIGDTPESAGSGPVFFSPYVIDNYRTSYDCLFAGAKGKGKSTMMKYFIEMDLAMGNKVRIIDVIPEFLELTKNHGGIVIKLDGIAGDRLNPLEILRMDDDENQNYLKHMSKLGHMFRLKYPSADNDTIDVFKNLLYKLYVKFGIIKPKEDLSSQQITGLNPLAYPIFSDLLELVKAEIDLYEDMAKEKESAKIVIAQLVKISSAISDIVNVYGSIFDGHTTIKNLLDADIIAFDISKISDLEPEIYDMQLFNVLSIAYDSCMTTGMKMKRLHDRKEIDARDIVYQTIYIDECHKSINSRKKHSVERMLDIMRQDRKFFIGIRLATQKVADLFPETTGETAEDLKALFSQIQYKFIYNDDEEGLKVIRRAFGSVISESQLDTLKKMGKREFLLNFGTTTLHVIGKTISEERLMYYGGGA